MGLLANVKGTCRAVAACELRKSDGASSLIFSLEASVKTLTWAGFFSGTPVACSYVLLSEGLEMGRDVGV